MLTRQTVKAQYVGIRYISRRIELQRPQGSSWAISDQQWVTNILYCQHRDKELQHNSLWLS